jgi:hypothetical protein
VQAPSFQLTPQTGSRVEVRFRPPREANIEYWRKNVQARCQRNTGIDGFDRLLKLQDLLRWPGEAPVDGRGAIYKFSHSHWSAPTFFGRKNDGKQPGSGADGGANCVG